MIKQQAKIECLVSKWYSIDQCRKNPTTLFIFGDNHQKIGMGGQAIIREQDNALGILTKKAPGKKEEDYFTDKEYKENCRLIDEDIERVDVYIDEKGYKAICFPFQGLGTGLAELQLRAPKTFCYLTIKLLDKWEFNNLGALKSA